MEKVQLPNQPPAAPMPVVIAGALVKGKENYLAIGAYGVMSMQPPLVYISSMKAHFTNAGIKETGYFSINVPSAGLVKKTDYCGLVSGRDTDKSKVFSVFYGKEKHAPLIRECPVNVVCKVVKTLEFPNNEVFIGEVVEYYADKTCLTDNTPDAKKIDPLLLAGRMYRKLGGAAGSAFSVGKALMKKP
ncbi:MAG: flavin reductase family protein [Methanoregula sp.]|uniref:flavin reductase family protein n=1 Tax=Methanoregula sp. TaxID=2052170 RepID=UPI003D13B097